MRIRMNKAPAARAGGALFLNTGGGQGKKSLRDFP
jgi:hypothetical protein